MKRLMYNFKKMHLVALCTAFFCGTANATVYTAAVSGNFNSAATWGGLLPGAILSSDVVIIPAGINVTLTNVQTLSGTTSLAVSGTLSSTTGGALVMPAGTLSGAGTISVDSMALGLTSGFTFTGALTARKLTSMGASIATATNVVVNKRLELAAGILNMSAGNLTMGNNSRILRSGGSITATGTGALHLDSVYSVSYLTASATTGAELTGTGLDSVIVNTPGTVTLAATTAVKGMLTLTAGTLALNGQTLTFNGAGNFSATGTGTIMSTAASNIVVNTTASLTGALRFAAGGNTINNFTVNTGSGSNVSLGSDLTANGIVTLSNGSLSLNGRTLTFNSTGNLSGSGTGTITGDAAANLVVNATAGLTGALRFTTGGNTLNNLTVNTGTGSMVMLGSDLTTNGMVTLTGGILALNGRTLTLGTAGNLASSGTGTIMGGTTSNLVINSTAGLTGTLRFATGGNTLNNLTVNTGAASSAFLGSDLNINGMMTMTAGTLALNGFDLVFNTASDLAGSGTGTITGNAASDIVVNSTTGLTGALRFATGANTINNLTVNTGSGGNVALGSDLNTNGMVTLSNGTLSLNGHMLTFNTTGNLAASGTGTITGNSASDIVVNTTTGLAGTLRFTTGGNILRNLTVNTGAASMVMLGTDLTTNGMITLTAGTLSLNGHTLTVGTTGNIASSGTGTIMGSTTSNMVINSATGLTGTLRFATGGNMLNALTVNTGTGSASLGSDLSINGMLTLTAGSLSLNTHDLTFNTGSDLAASGTGTITGNTSSDIIVNSTTGLTGVLRFAAGANTINDLTINTGAAGNVSLGSDVTTNGMVTLNNGTLSLNGHTLTIANTGDLSASGAGTIMGSATSGLVINTTGSLASQLRFATGGNMLNNLTINTTSGGNVGLSSDLMINGMLSLSTGTLMLNGHALTFNTASDLAAAGSGMIMGTATSDIVVNSTAGLSGTLRFTTSGNALRNFVVNTGAANSISLGSDLIVNGTLNLQSGKIRLNTNSLNIATSGNVTGGSASSYVMTNGSGKLVMNLSTAATSTFQVGTSSNYAPMVITANSAATTGDVSINVADGVLTGGTTGTSLSAAGSVVNATWFVSSSATTINYDMKAMWSAGMEVNGFDRNHAFISHYTAGAWDTYITSAATTSGSMYSVTRAGITSLSPFMVDDSTGTAGTPVITAVQPAIAVYPNPTSNVLHFASNTAIESVSIYDMNGKCVQASTVNNNEINVSDLATGAYVIHLIGQNIDVAQHFTKQ